MRKIIVKKLFLGHASIRDYIVAKAIEKAQGIIVSYEEKKMLISLEQLKHRFQFHRQKFQSKYSNKEYELVDFRFKEDK